MLLNSLKKYICPIIISFILFLISFCFKIDGYFVNYDNINIRNYEFIKILFFIILTIACCFIAFVYRKIKQNDSVYKRGALIFFVYFFLVSVLIFLIWPGAWSWDDIFVLMCVKNYNFNAWHHILTSIFQLLCIQILPFPAGIIIIQNVLISMCVAFIILKIEKIYSLFLKNKLLDLVVKLIPFFLFPILLYQFTGYEFGLYSYLEIVLFCLFLYMGKTNEKISFGNLIFFSVIIAVVSSWRAESIILVIVGILFLLWCKNIGNIKRRIVIVSFMVILSSLILIFQKIELNQNGYANNYGVVTTINQVCRIIANSDAMSDVDIKNKISKVINLDVVYENPYEDGIKLFWDKSLVKDNYTNNDTLDYYSAVAVLYAKYPDLLVKERLNILYRTSGLNGAINMPFSFDMIEVFEERTKDTDIFFRNNFIFNKPFSKKLRKEIINILSMKNHPRMYRIIWNPILPCLFLFLGLIYTICKRKKIESFIISLIFAKIFIIFIAQPAPLFHYYISMYLDGYMIFVYSVFALFCQKIKKYSI